MIHVITSDNRHLYEPELLAHFRLRHEIYVVERNWTNLASPDGLERDQFDNNDATYILASENGQIIGVRALCPQTGRICSAKCFRILQLFAVYQGRLISMSGRECLSSRAGARVGRWAGRPGEW